MNPSLGACGENIPVFDAPLQCFMHQPSPQCPRRVVPRSREFLQAWRCRLACEVPAGSVKNRDVFAAALQGRIHGRSPPALHATDGTCASGEDQSPRELKFIQHVFLSPTV